MASGLSKRFGCNKLMENFHGEPMIARILSVTDGLFGKRVVVTRYQDIAEICIKRDIDVIFHDLPDRSDTVRLGLEAIGEDVNSCMFCPSDQPLLRRETVVSLIEAARQEMDAIWRPCFNDMPGSPVLFPKWAFNGLLHLPKGKGGGYIARMHPDAVRFVPVRDKYELMDADDRETFEMLLHIDSDK